jgi:preprotein translocase subunit SecY
MASILYKLEPLYRHFPEIKEPQRHVKLKEKFMWVGIVLILYLLMGQITPLGVDKGAVDANLGILQIVFASQIGSLMSVGIGPIVTASIILQLLVGAKMINLDLHDPEDRSVFQGTQKLFTILIALFEAYAFVSIGAIPVEAGGGLPLIIFVTLQIAFASVLLMFLDEIVSKWGIGSGIGLFIAAGVSQSIVVQALSPVPAAGGGFAGIIPNFLAQLSAGQLNLVLLWPVAMTILVFLAVAYFESLKIEIPLSYGRFGIGARYPLKFFYTSNIPVILASAVLANVVRFAGVFAGMGVPWLGNVNSQNQIVQSIEGGGLGYLMTAGDLRGIFSPEQIDKLGRTESLFYNRQDISCDGVIETDAGTTYCVNPDTEERQAIACSGEVLPDVNYQTGEIGGYFCKTGGISIPSTLIHLFVYAIIFIGFCVLFGVFWVMMSSMDAETVSEQMESSGLQIPGFRADKRVIRRVLERYIPQLTVVSAVAVGLLAVLADLTGALGTGTGILLTVGIVYRMYEEIKQEQLNELSPALRKFIGGDRR